jgi:hypothetical protein
MALGIKSFIAKIFPKVGDIIAKQLKADVQETIMEYALKNEEELTKRLEIDMTSDSWLSKNVRPLSLVFMTLMVTFFAFTDGNIGQFSINESYVKLYEGLLLTVYMFYFGSRGVEKTMKLYKK